ncbi:MAG: site-specific integrase [Phycisphaerales bacterium]|jgi:integrase
MGQRRTFGGIRKLPSGRYQAFYTGPDLKRHSAPVTFTARLDAEAWLAAERKHVEAPETWQSPKARQAATLARREREKARTFGRYAADWLAHRELAARTRHNYQNLLDRYLLPTFNETPIAYIDRAMVKAWHRQVAPGKTHQRKHAYDLLRAILNTALDDELIAINPVHIRGAGSVKRTGKTEPATLAELETLTAATPEGYRLMVLLAAWCALRRGELGELRRGDVDTKHGVLRIRRAVAFIPGETIVKGPKTDAGSRDVVIPEHLLPLVREHLLKHTQKGANGLLFPSPRGNPLRDSTLGRWYYPAREAAGRPDLRFHDLRHTGAVLAAQSGATIAELMHRLGHTTPAAAMRYQHAAADRDREIARRMSVMYATHTEGGQ